MPKKILLIALCNLLLTTVLSGQCPDRTALYHRIIYLRDTLKAPDEEQLAELLPYVAKIKKCPGSGDSTEALLLQRIGGIYVVMENYVSGIDYLRQSIDVIQAGYNRRDIIRSLLVRCYYNLELCYEALQQPANERAAADSCIAASLQLNTGYYRSVPLLIAKVIYLFGAGDYYRCIDYADIGMRVTNENAGAIDNPVSRYNGFFTYKMDCLIFLGKFKEAETALDKTIRSLPSRSDSLGSVYGLYARVMVAKGNLTKALLYYDSCIYFNTKIRSAQACAEAYNNIGFTIFYEAKRQPEKALQYYYKALAYHDSAESLNILSNIAKVYVKKGKYDSALHFFQQAFDQIRPGSTETDLVTYFRNYEGNKVVEYITRLVLDKADTYLLMYKQSGKEEHLRQTIQAYKTADHIFDMLKLQYPKLESALSRRAKNRSLYEHAIEACYKGNNTGDAFYFFEKSRAVLLSDQLKDQRLLANSDILNLSQVKRELLNLGRQKDTLDVSSSQYKIVQQDIVLHGQELRRLQELIRQRNPLWYQSFLDNTIAGLQEVRQKLLKDHQALLEVFNGDSAVYTLLVTANNAVFTQINKKNFDSITQQYLRYIADPALLNLHFDNYKKIAFQLYQLLFQNNPVPAGRIIISPDGRYFPFESLVVNNSSPATTWFLDEHAISYTYSANFLMNDFNGNTGHTINSFMGVAPVNFPAGFNLATLYESDLSLKRIGSHFSNPYNLTGAGASRSKFLQQFSGYLVIQLYAHASDSSVQGEPVIYFADSALFLSDLIPEEKPATRLIVLSACETASGKLYQGEGIFSFSRGFAALGIPASVTNLWVIDNKATYRLTELFYKYLAEKNPPDIALQKAKLEFIKTATGTEKLPYYWAATILAGKTDMIEYAKPINWTILLIAAGITLVLLVALILRINTRRKKNLTPSSLNFYKQYNSN